MQKGGCAVKRIFYGIVLIIVILGIHHDLTGGTFAEEKGTSTPPAPLAVHVKRIKERMSHPSPIKK